MSKFKKSVSHVKPKKPIQYKLDVQKGTIILKKPKRDWISASDIKNITREDFLNSDIVSKQPDFERSLSVALDEPNSVMSTLMFGQERQYDHVTRFHSYPILTGDLQGKEVKHVLKKWRRMQKDKDNYYRYTAHLISPITNKEHETVEATLVFKLDDGRPYVLSINSRTKGKGMGMKLLEELENEFGFSLRYTFPFSKAGARLLYNYEQKKLSTPKEYYTTSRWMPFKEFVDLEVKERGNYSMKDVKKWMKKYNLTNDTEAIWVSPKKWVANRYDLPASEWDEAEHVPEKEMNVDTITIVPEERDNHFIIPESNDGEHGFLLVRK